MLDLYCLAWPFLRTIEPEKAHGLALKALKSGFAPKPTAYESRRLGQTLWGMNFANPVGLAAGFDKNAEVYNEMLGHGFGFVEVGSITPKPQPGNPQPRLFRLTEDKAVINRMGFNNEGHAYAESQLKKKRGGIVGVNLGKNKTSEDAADDYVQGVKNLGPYADYLVVNVSSPNTPGLRALQGRESLEQLLKAVLAALPSKRSKDHRPPLLLKIAPDLTDEDKQDIADVALALKLDGLIVSNTTIERPDWLRSNFKGETGGLSGAPLFAPSTQVLSEMYRLTKGKIPLVGVGGIASGKQAYEKIRAGASLVQLYSALVYQGTGLVYRIKRDLDQMLLDDGFMSVVDAVGVDSK